MNKKSRILLFFCLCLLLLSVCYLIRYLIPNFLHAHLFVLLLSFLCSVIFFKKYGYNSCLLFFISIEIIMFLLYIFTQHVTYGIMIGEFAFLYEEHMVRREEYK